MQYQALEICEALTPTYLDTLNLEIEINFLK